MALSSMSCRVTSPSAMGAARRIPDTNWLEMVADSLMVPPGRPLLLIRTGGQPSPARYSILQPCARRASTMSLRGRCCMRLLPVTITDPPASLTVVTTPVRKRALVPELPRYWYTHTHTHTHTHKSAIGRGRRCI